MTKSSLVTWVTEVFLRKWEGFGEVKALTGNLAVVGPEEASLYFRKKELKVDEHGSNVQGPKEDSNRPSTSHLLFNRV